MPLGTDQIGRFPDVICIVQASPPPDLRAFRLAGLNRGLTPEKMSEVLAP